jgi:DNA-binding NtrC family response regulator
VLIVDDEPRIREVLARWLTPAGYETREAGDAEVAIELLNKASSDVVLCDMQMPGKGGRWLVEQVREKFPSVAVVLATADESVPPFVSMRGGVVDYLVKPFSRERVLEAVSRAVDWHRAEIARGPRTKPAGDPLENWIRPGPK